MSKLNRKRMTELEDDSGLSKNHGENIRYRKRLIEEREARMAREDALRDIAEDEEYENRRTERRPY